MSRPRAATSVATSMRDLAGLEPLDHLEALGLGKVAHDELAVEAVDLEPAREFLDHEFLVAEDQAALGPLAIESAEEERELLVRADVVELLRDELDRDLLGLDRNLLGLPHILPGEVLDPKAEGGGEEVGLALARPWGDSAGACADRR